jgi:hypothetical protein
MLLVGVLLILLGGLFLFAALTGVPRAILGVEKETPAIPAEKLTGSQDHDLAQAGAENPVPQTSESEDTPLATPDEWSTPSEDPQTVSDAPPVSTTDQPPPEIRPSRRISSAALGIVGMAVGILALLDSSL